MNKKWWMPAILTTTLVAYLGTVATGGGREAHASPDAKDQPSKERKQLLESLGTLSAAHYYQTYLNIGFIADGKAEGIYGDKEARKVLDSVLSLLATSDRQLDNVGKLGLEKEDQNSLEQMRKLSALLRDQGKELEAYWETGDQTRSAKYDSLRRSSWRGISQLMGLEK